MAYSYSIKIFWEYAFVNIFVCCISVFWQESKNFCAMIVDYVHDAGNFRGIDHLQDKVITSPCPSSNICYPESSTDGASLSRQNCFFMLLRQSQQKSNESEKVIMQEMLPLNMDFDTFFQNQQLKTWYWYYYLHYSIQT